MEEIQRRINYEIEAMNMINDSIRKSMGGTMDDVVKALDKEVDDLKALSTKIEESLGDCRTCSYGYEGVCIKDIKPKRVGGKCPGYIKQRQK